MNNKLLSAILAALSLAGVAVANEIPEGRVGPVNAEASQEEDAGGCHDRWEAGGTQGGAEMRAAYVEWRERYLAERPDEAADWPEDF